MSVLQQVESLRETRPGITWDEIAAELGYDTSGKVRWAYRKEKIQSGLSSEPLQPNTEEVDERTPVEFMDKKIARSVNWRDFASVASDHKDVLESISNQQKIANVEINTRKPIGILFTGDWHLGDIGVDYRTWINDIDKFLASPLYMVDLGDDYQNMRSFKSLAGVLNQVLQPREQAIMMRSIVNELTEKDKLLAKIGGNHDEEFDDRIFGEALQSYLYENAKAPIFPNRGLLKLKVGDINYSLLLLHKSRFRSIFRPAHGAYREHQLSFPADIVAAGHDHTPGFELIPNYQLAQDAGFDFGGYSYLIKIGTYQDSNYGWRYFHNGGKPFFPTVVLHPGEKKMQIFFEMDDAIQYLQRWS